MSRGVCTSVLTPERGVEGEEMRTPEDVLEMRRLHGLGWGTRRIAAQLGCSRTTVQVWLRRGRWRKPARRRKRRVLVGWEEWLRDRLAQPRREWRREFRPATQPGAGQSSRWGREHRRSYPSCSRTAIPDDEQPNAPENTDGSELRSLPARSGESVKGGILPFHKNVTTNRNSPPRAEGGQGSFDCRREAPGGPGTGA